MLLVIVITDAPIDALLIPLKPPGVKVVAALKWLMFCIILASTSTVEVTEAPMAIPVKDVAVAVDVDKTRILLVAAPAPVLPIILVLICDGALALFA